MSKAEWLFTRQVPSWPFDVANRAIVPLSIMAFGMWRTWLTATTPFEELTGLLLSIGVGLMWCTCFGFAARRNPRIVDV